MSRTLVPGIIAALCLLAIYFFLPKQHKVQTIPSSRSNDTSYRYIKFFKHVGTINGNDISTDTDAYAIRIIKDSTLIIKDTTDDKISITRTFIRDTTYYVPLDSLLHYKFNDTVHHKIKDTAFHRTIYLQLINKQWIIWDYNKLSGPLSTWQ